MNFLQTTKKLLLAFMLLSVFAFCFPKSVYAQFTETFETATTGSSSFTSNAKTFNLTNNLGTAAPTGFKVFNGAGLGYNFSNGFIHAEDVGITYGQTGVIKAASGGFKLNGLYIYLTGDAAQNAGVTNGGAPGSVTFRGKLAGNTQFTVVKTTTGANIGYSLPGNGFISIDFSTEGGSDNTNVTIDELEIELSANYDYFAIDNFAFTDVVTCVVPTITANPPNRSLCNGYNTTFTASATGATAWQWHVNTGAGFGPISNGGVYSGATTATLTVTGATAAMNGYTYRAVAINGDPSCSSTSNAGTLTVSSINLNSSSQTNVACFLGNNGTATVAPSGGVGGYTYLWSNGATSSTVTGLTAGSYSVTVTDAISCTATKNFTITQPTALNGTTVVTNVACFGSNTGAINLTPTGGTPGYTFLWSDGATTEDRTSLVAGTYSVTITDANSCIRTVSGITVTQPTAAVSGTTVVTNVACFGGNTGAINLTPTGGVGPYTFNWSSGPTTEDRTGLVAGTYSVTITDANGCTGTVSGITVTQPTAVVSGTTVVTNIACNGGNTGAIDLTPTGGVGPYTYNWTSGPTTQDRTGLLPGSYSVTITDANGCTGVVSGITVTQPTAINGTTLVTNVACNGGSNGVASVTASGGAGGYTYLWSNGATTSAVTGLPAGSYSVTVTDANSCAITINNITVNQPTVINGTTVVTNVSCNGGANGTATVTPSGGAGGYTYLWSNGATTQTATGLMVGLYSVTITDVNACSRTIDNITVTQPTALIATATAQNNVSCFGGSNGTATVNATGGTPGYSYSWAPSGGTAATASGLAAGTYTVTVTDANSCQTTQSFTITQPAVLALTAAAQTNIACFGGATGAASVNAANGGAGGYTYDWSPGNPTGDGTTSVFGLAAGTYTVTVTDANGCTADQTFTISQPAAALTASAGVQTAVSCFNGSNGSATVSVTGGTPGYTYSWAPSGGTAATASGLTAGIYTVTVTDANGCTATQTFTISQPAAALTASAGAQNNVTCNGGANGSATVSVTGGTPGYTYAWAPSGGTAAIASGLAAGTYTVTVIDANACTTTQTFTISEPNALALASASLADGTVSVAYSRTFAATGGSETFNYSSIGVLPTGMTLSSGGVLSGIPTTAGSYAFTIRATDQVCSSIVDQNYTLTIASGAQTITFAPLANKVYGDAAITLPEFSSACLPVSYSSSNQNVATITGNTLTITGAGTTNITASQAGDGSYLAATDVIQSLTVTGKPITGTFTVSNKAYDGTTTATIQSRTLLGVEIADQADVSLTGGTATFASVDAGNGIIVSQTGMSLTGSKAGNYILQSVAPSTGTINPTPLTVRANALSKAYGDADPVLTYTTNGLIAGDALSGSLSRSAGDGVGSYPITASGLNAGSNYILNFVGADFTINKRVLTVTADDKSRLFNVANPALTITYSGFANGETSAVLSSPATASTTATISSPGGTYPIVPGGAAAANYSFNYVNGTLTVTANSQTITFAALADKLSTDPIFTLNAISSAGLTVSFSSSDASIARIVNGNQVEILKAGTVNITASQAGNANYAAATPVVQSLKIIDNPAPIIAITSSRGTSFNKGESTTLTATGATTYVWSNAVGIISGQNTDKLTVRPVANTVYTVTGSNQFGRTSTQTIAITLVDNLAVVEVVRGASLLTPNGDGINDYFVVKNIDLYPNNTVTIYDVTGKTLYKTVSYKNDWDGSVNGNPLQTGSYYYIIEFGDGKTSAKKGYITVIKQ